MRNFVALWSKNKYFRPFVIIIILLSLFGSSFIPLHSITGNGAFIVSSIFPITAGWLLGLRLGLLFWFLHAVLLMFLARAVGSGMDAFFSSGIFSYTVTFLITCGMGRIKDLTQKLQYELRERKRIELELHQYQESLEKQVKERTRDLTRSNEQLKLEMLQNEKINQEKLNLQTSLKRAEKMESIGILAGSVAHDLNNILSGIMSYPELILLDIPEDSPIRKPLLTIQNSGQRAAAVVQDLLTLVRKETINSKVINLNQIISDFLQSPECEKMVESHPGTTMEIDLEPELMSMCGSPLHLSKAVMNLLINAMEAMTKGGRLIISTVNVHGKPEGSYEVMEEGHYVAIKVSDTGGGIPIKDLDRIFEPFYTKKVMGRSGTGLGLAIVWGTVKDHGGYVDIQSQEGEGTTFTLYFPATNQEEVLDREPRPIWQDYTGNGESILVIDDEKMQSDLCTSFLKKMGYAVQSVSSGEAAIDFLLKNSVDLLILDMIMDGGIDGLETYKRITQINPGQKAIIVSGFSESERVKSAQAMGAGAFIRKPYQLEKLGMAVKNQFL